MTQQMTVKEAIEFCIAKGIKSAESQLNSFNKRGRLPDKSQIKSLKENLEQFYEHVEITGGGKRGRVILSGLKDTPSKRITGNQSNGKKRTEDDEILTEYFFKRLCTLPDIQEKGWAETLNQWGIKYLDLLGIGDQAETFISLMDETFFPHLEEKHVKRIGKSVFENVRSSRRTVVEQSIKRLEDANRIEVVPEYVRKHDEESAIGSMIIEVEGSKYCKILGADQERIEKALEAHLEPYGVSYKRFKAISAFPQFTKSKEEEEALEVGNKFLSDEYGIDYLFTQYRIFVLKPETAQEISHKEAKTAYINKFKTLTDNRMNRKDYQRTHKYQNAFYRLATYLYLNVIESEKVGFNLSADIEEMKSTIAETVVEVQSAFIEKFGTIEPYEPIAPEGGWGFGANAVSKGKVTPIFTDEEIEQLLNAHKPEVMKANEMNIQQIQEAESVEVKPMSKELDWLNRIAPKRERKDEISPERAARIKEIAESKSGLIDMDALLDDEPIKQTPRPVKRFGADLFATSKPECPEPFGYDEVLDIPDEVKEIWAMEAAQQYEYDLAFAV